MRKLISILALGILLVSCELETSGNKELDGYWKMEQVDTLSTGGVADTRESLVFWGIQGKLLQIRYSEDGNYLGEGLLFRFSREDSYLRLYSPVLHHLYETDEPIEDVEILKPFGIFNLEEVFYLEGLNDDVLVVSNDQLRLYFRRY